MSKESNYTQDINYFENYIHIQPSQSTIIQPINNNCEPNVVNNSSLPTNYYDANVPIQNAYFGYSNIIPANNNYDTHLDDDYHRYIKWYDATSDFLKLNTTHTDTMSYDDKIRKKCSKDNIPSTSTVIQRYNNYQRFLYSCSEDKNSNTNKISKRSKEKDKIPYKDSLKRNLPSKCNFEKEKKIYNSCETVKVVKYNKNKTDNVCKLDKEHIRKRIKDIDGSTQIKTSSNYSDKKENSTDGKDNEKIIKAYEDEIKIIMNKIQNKKHELNKTSTQRPQDKTKIAENVLVSKTNSINSSEKLKNNTLVEDDKQNEILKPSETKHAKIANPENIITKNESDVSTTPDNTKENNVVPKKESKILRLKQGLDLNNKNQPNSTQNVTKENEGKFAHNIQKICSGVNNRNKSTRNISRKRKSPLKSSSKAETKQKKIKKIKLVIKYGERSSTSETSESDQETPSDISPTQDLSFLEDFNVDEIVDCLNKAHDSQITELNINGSNVSKSESNIHADTIRENNLVSKMEQGLHKAHLKNEDNNTNFRSCFERGDIDDDVNAETCANIYKYILQSYNSQGACKPELLQSFNTNTEIVEIIDDSDSQDVIHIQNNRNDDIFVLSDEDCVIATKPKNKIESITAEEYLGNCTNDPDIFLKDASNSENAKTKKRETKKDLQDVIHIQNNTNDDIFVLSDEDCVIATKPKNKIESITAEEYLGNCTNDPDIFLKDASNSENAKTKKRETKKDLNILIMTELNNTQSNTKNNNETDSKGNFKSLYNIQPTTTIGEHNNISKTCHLNKNQSKISENKLSNTVTNKATINKKYENNVNSKPSKNLKLLARDTDSKNKINTINGDDNLQKHVSIGKSEISRKKIKSNYTLELIERKIQENKNKVKALSKSLMKNVRNIRQYSLNQLSNNDNEFIRRIDKGSTQYDYELSDKQYDRNSDIKQFKNRVLKNKETQNHINLPKIPKRKLDSPIKKHKIHKQYKEEPKIPKRKLDSPIKKHKIHKQYKEESIKFKHDPTKPKLNLKITSNDTAPNVNNTEMDYKTTYESNKASGTVLSSLQNNRITMEIANLCGNTKKTKEKESTGFIASRNTEQNKVKTKKSNKNNESLTKPTVATKALCNTGIVKTKQSLIDKNNKSVGNSNNDYQKMSQNTSGTNTETKSEQDVPTELNINISISNRTTSKNSDKSYLNNSKGNNIKRNSHLITPNIDNTKTQEINSNGAKNIIIEDPALKNNNNYISEPVVISEQLTEDNISTHLITEDATKTNTPCDINNEENVENNKLKSVKISTVININNKENLITTLDPCDNELCTSYNKDANNTVSKGSPSNIKYNIDQASQEDKNQPQETITYDNSTKKSDAIPIGRQIDMNKLIELTKTNSDSTNTQAIETSDEKSDQCIEEDITSADLENKTNNHTTEPNKSCEINTKDNVKSNKQNSDTVTNITNKEILSNKINLDTKAQDNEVCTNKEEDTNVTASKALTSNMKGIVDTVYQTQEDKNDQTDKYAQISMKAKEPDVMTSVEINQELIKNPEEFENKSPIKSVVKLTNEVVEKCSVSNIPECKNKILKSVNDYHAAIEWRMFKCLNERFTISDFFYKKYAFNVYKCNDSHKKPYLLKISKHNCYNSAVGSEKILLKLQRNVADHSCIDFVIASFDMKNSRCLLMEYYPKTLRDALLENKKCFYIDLVQSLTRQLVSAVSTLTMNGIIHADIQPRNIVMNATNDRLKLSGFDRAGYASYLKILPNTSHVSYRAPEAVLGFEADYRIDVWATALIMYEMATNKTLFQASFNSDLLFSQIRTMGSLNFDMVSKSRFRDLYFNGYSFIKRTSQESSHLVHNFQRNERLRNSIFNTYHEAWGVRMSKWQQTQDYDKLEAFHDLLEKMLVLDPRCRLPITFVAAHEFISDFSQQHY